MEIITHIRNIPILKQTAPHLPYSKNLKTLLSGKRKAGILCEVLFWQQVHKKKFYKIDFDRQRIIGHYIVDLYVKNLGLVVEIDGWSHENKVEYDRQRQRELESLGLKVFRIYNYDVLHHLPIVMKELEDFIILHYGAKET